MLKYAISIQKSMIKGFEDTEMREIMGTKVLGAETGFG